MPDRYPPSSTYHRYFQAWVKSGVFIHILKVLAEDLYARGQLDLSECFIDGTFVPAKKGASAWARQNVARGARSWPLQTALAFLSPFTYEPLDAALAARGIEMLAPHRSSRRKPKTQDGRKLRRYKQRWKIERLNGAAELSPRVGTLRALSGELSRLCPSGVYQDSVATLFSRLVLILATAPQLAS